MKLARVIGTVVSTRKVECIKDLKILMIQPLDEKLENSGPPVAAIDTVQAGFGELVYYIMAREASLALPDPFAPVDAAITGIVDQVNVEDVGIKNKKSIFEKGSATPTTEGTGSSVPDKNQEKDCFFNKLSQGVSKKDGKK